jgi:V8-like Glu-specific endopeptidase
MPKGAPLLIAQHPQGEPIKLAIDMDAVLGLNGNATRVRYATNTEPGSSGSPCFDMDWTLVALHHMGDPRWRNPQYNEGVPISLIRARLARQGALNG